MASGRQVTLALGVGYLLGRGRKNKMTIMLGAATLTGASTGPVAQLLRRGVKTATTSVGSAGVLGKISPQFGEIAGLVRGDLVDAGKAAATAAVNNRVESLAGQLHERAEALRNPAEVATRAADGAQEAGERATQAQRSARGQVRSAAAGRGAGRAAGAARSTTGANPGSGAGQRATSTPRRSGEQAGSPVRVRQAQETAGRPPVRRAPRTASQGR